MLSVQQLDRYPEVLYYLSRILVTLSVFFFLSRNLCQTTALLFSKSNRELCILGAMPLVYYLFDYATTKFSTLLYSGSKVIVEFLAFSMCLSYVVFLLVYFREYEMKHRAEQYGELMDMQLNSLRTEIDQTRVSERSMAILRHDMRHHLAAIETFIRQQKTDRALEYIQEINRHYDDTVIRSFCKNELLNSVLSIYSTRFSEKGISFDPQIQVSESLPCPELTLLRHSLKYPGKCHARGRKAAGGKTSDQPEYFRKIRSSADAGKKSH